MHIMTVAQAKAIVGAFYVGYFDRAPDPGGLDHWTQWLLHNGSTTELVKAFNLSDEAKSIYPELNDDGSVSNPVSFLEKVYANLFNRPLDESGKKFWSDHMENGLSPLQVIEAIVTNVTGPDATILANRVNAGIYYADLVEAFDDEEYVMSKARDVIDDVGYSKSSFEEGLQKARDYTYPEAETIEVIREVEVIVIKEVPTEVIVEKIVYVDKVVEVEVPVYIDRVEYVDREVIVEVPVEVEPDHIVSYSTGELHISGTNNFAGNELWVGDGIYTDGHIIVTDETAGYELAMSAMYRQGDLITGTIESPGVIRVSAEAGHQELGDGGSFATHLGRSAVSFNYTINGGVGELGEDGLRYYLLIDTDPGVDTTNFMEIEFRELAPDLWAGVDTSNDTPVIGDEVAYPQIIQESTNFGFGFISSQIDGVGPAGTGDIPAGEYEVYLQLRGADGTTVHAQAGIIFDLYDEDLISTTGLPEAPMIDMM